MHVEHVKVPGLPLVLFIVPVGEQTDIFNQLSDM